MPSRLFRALCLVTRNRFEAEELAQDAFLACTSAGIGSGSLGPVCPRFSRTEPPFTPPAGRIAPTACSYRVMEQVEAAQEGAIHIVAAGPPFEEFFELPPPRTRARDAPHPLAPGDSARPIGQEQDSFSSLTAQEGPGRRSFAPARSGLSAATDPRTYRGSRCEQRGRSRLVKGFSVVWWCPPRVERAWRHLDVASTFRQLIGPKPQIRTTPNKRKGPVTRAFARGR